MKSITFNVGLLLAIPSMLPTAQGQNPPADLRGIYVYTNDVSQIGTGIANQLTASFNLPGVDGVAVVIGWNAIEPSLGQYQFSLLDQWIAQVSALGKKIDLVIPSGSSTPAWLFQPAPSGAGATELNFTVSPHGGSTGVCDTVNIAAPWDPAFLTQWDAMLAAVSAHLKSAGTYNAITLVRLTGINRSTEELRLPAETAASTGLACVSNSIATWQQAGYRPSLLLQAWNTILASFTKSFPDKSFAVSIIPSDAFPGIAEDGSVITGHIGDENEPLLMSGSQQLGNRLVVQFDFLMPGEAASTVVTNAVENYGTLAAFQTNEYLGGQGAACSEPVTSPTPCNAATYLTLLQTGIYPLGQANPLRAQYIEVFHANATAFPADIQQAHLDLTCNYALSVSGEGFSSAGGTGTINIATGAGCPWTIGTPAPGITITSPASGTGPGTVTFQVAANSGGDLSNSFTIAEQTFTVEQEAASISGLNFVGSMPHLAAEENWTTAFTLVNKSAASATARLSLFGDAADSGGNGPLGLPLAFPQQSGTAGAELASSLDRSMAANSSLILDTAGPQTPPVLVGSAQLAATGAVDGFAIFHQIVTTQEAVVPMETRNASSYLLAFDNTNGLVLGVAVENVSGQNALIPVIIRDDTGAVVSSPGASISLGGNGHIAFVLSDPLLGFPVTANKRGTIEFDTPAGGQISVLGLRFTPPNNALTTIPALANVGAGGGSIAHLASGGDGWQTTFVLVNVGNSAVQVTLSFFADQTGAPMPLPLSFPQTGSVSTVPSVTQPLAAGATLLIVSSGAPQLLTGSAQLSTTGHVSGFVIFRHNGQEAVVPLESRAASGYIVAFDNTNGTATGIAVNAVSTGQVNVPVVVRDDTGAQIAADMIAMAPNGHYAFTLGTDRYPGTATIRGTIEFDKPAGAQIGALGIRIPAVAAHTYTTLPALAK
jgi:Beta-galactosidase